MSRRPTLRGGVRVGASVASVALWQKFQNAVSVSLCAFALPSHPKSYIANPAQYLLCCPFALMENPTPNPELLRSLGRLARGLSALFWGLPAALIICAETVRMDFLQPYEVAPAIIANALLLFGLWQMSSFQKQERPWRNALDRAKLLGLVNLGLCPFLFWFNRMPGQGYFHTAINVLVLSAVFFLFNLNIVLQRLGAMLPDETLRHDINQFSALNRWLLVVWLFLVILASVLPQLIDFSKISQELLPWVLRGEIAALLFLGLSPLAVTMALIWKTKEVIFDSVFGAR